MPTGRPTGLAPLVAALAAALVLAGCGTPPRGGAGPDAGELPDQEVGDFTLTETDQGRPEWKLYARSAAMYRMRSTIVARGVRLDFFDADGQRSSELTAREGEINERTRDMTARGGVVIQTAAGARMTTEELRFLNREQRIVSDHFVRVQRGDDVLTGYGFESDPELRHFEFKRRVQATVRTPPRGPRREGP